MKRNSKTVVIRILFQEKCSVHEGGVRGAAAVWSPLFSKHYVSSDLIHITDWLPTLFEAAGKNFIRHAYNSKLVRFD